MSPHARPFFDHVARVCDGTPYKATETARGFDVELDGHIYPMDATDFSVSLEEEKVTLVSFGELGMRISSLRERRLIIDSPRVLARDDRAAGRSRPE